MAARAHAKLSPSGADRWLIHCTPSASLEAQFPNSAGEAAEEGTAAHALCEHKLKKALKRRSRRPHSDFDSDEEISYMYPNLGSLVITTLIFGKSAIRGSNAFVPSSYILISS